MRNKINGKIIFYGLNISITSLNTSLFEVVYGRPPPMLATYKKGIAHSEEVEKDLLAWDEILANLKNELEKA